MRVAVGVDHRGFLIKSDVIKAVEEAGHEPLDVGTDSPEPVDYPDVAQAVANAVRSQAADRGVLVCGSGAGAVIAANKIPGIRAAQAHDAYTAHQCVEHDDANVVVLGSGIVGVEIVREVLTRFLAARFVSEERYVRRLEKVRALEAEGTTRPPAGSTPAL